MTTQNINNKYDAQKKHRLETVSKINIGGLKDRYSSQIEIIKGLTDKGQFQYLTN